MSMDRSLKTASSLARHRNVLTRAERLKRLKDQERWNDDRSVFGLPKVANRVAKVGKKTKKKEEGAEGAAATPAAEGAVAATAKGAAAKGASPAKAAAPAKGAPAAKSGKK